MQKLVSTLRSPSGFHYAFLAYGTWGLFPLYWKLLKNIPALEVLFYRILWSWFFYTLYRTFKNKKLSLGFRGLEKKSLALLILSAVLLSTNWYIYISAVQNQKIIETSLGYFINPLLNVFFGMLLFRERLSKTQSAALVSALVGVGFLTFHFGQIPWISLSLAFTFCFYGILRKIISIPSFHGGQIESMVMIPFFMAFYFGTDHSLPTRSPLDFLFLVGSGLVTALPLIWFSEASKRMNYSMLGFIQFLTPSVQFCIGYFYYQEPLSIEKFYGYLWIWSGCFLLLLEFLSQSLKRHRNPK